MIRIFNRIRPKALIILCVLMLSTCCYIDGKFNNEVFGCESDGTGSGEGANNAGEVGGQVSDGVGVAQMDNSTHEGNGGESWTLIDCNDPFWWDLVPCSDGNDD